MSRPWHGPYRVLSSNDPDVTVVNVYLPKDKWVDQLLSKEELPDQRDSEESTEHNNPVDPESGTEEESEDKPPASDKLLAGDMHSIPITSGSDAPARAQSTRYGLRRKISPPERYT